MIPLCCPALALPLRICYTHPHWVIYGNTQAGEDRMPKAAATLLWSPERERYEWQHRGESSSSPVSPEETSGFLRLVGGSSSFAFQGQHGHLTLRKESRLHGEGYWYAYRSQGRRTRKKYLGRRPSLSIARLEDIAEALNAEPRASTDERSQVQGETIPKLQLPRLPASLVTRERLLTRLDTGWEGKLTLLSAPAGFGKTTLVSQWIAQRRKLQPQAHVAWLSLDPGDNDLIRFWRYVMLACRALQAESDQAALALLRTRSSFASSPLEPMLRTFLNALTSLPRRGML